MSPRGAWQAARSLALTAVAAAAAACGGGDEGLRCQEPGEYATSRTAPPVRVPEGLSVPNETDALTIPPGGTASGPGDDQDEGEDSDERGCLERPPDYFEGGEPGGASQ